MTAHDTTSISVLVNESSQEIEIAQALTDQIKAELRRKGLSSDRLAAELDMIDAAADRLLRTPRWTLPTAIRVADKLGLDVTFALSEPAA